MLWTIKVFKKAKTLFNNLKTDPASVIFAEEFLDNKLLKKLKKLHHDVDKQLFKLVNLADSKNFLDNGKSPTRNDYVEKREIDRSTLYSFDGPFQFLHTDVGNLEYLGKTATFPQQVLLYCRFIYIKSLHLLDEIS